MKQKWPSSGKRTTVSIKQTPKLLGDLSVVLHGRELLKGQRSKVKLGALVFTFRRVLICGVVF